MASKTYRADSEAARAAAYRGAVNPFEEGTRRHRLFGKWRGHHDRMEGDFAEMAMVHGHPWPPEGAQLRHQPMSEAEIAAAPRTAENERVLADMAWWGERLPEGWGMHGFTGRQHALLVSPAGRLVQADAELLAALTRPTGH